MHLKRRGGVNYVIVAACMGGRPGAKLRALSCMRNAFV